MKSRDSDSWEDHPGDIIGSNECKPCQTKEALFVNEMSQDHGTQSIIECLESIVSNRNMNNKRKVLELLNKFGKIDVRIFMKVCNKMNCKSNAKFLGQILTTLEPAVDRHSKLSNMEFLEFSELVCKDFKNQYKMRMLKICASCWSPSDKLEKLSTIQQILMDHNCTDDFLTFLLVEDKIELLIDDKKFFQALLIDNVLNLDIIDQKLTSTLRTLFQKHKYEKLIDLLIYIDSAIELNDYFDFTSMKNNRIYNILKKMNSNFEIYFDYMPNYVALLTFSHLLYLSRKFRASSLLYPMLTSHVLYYLQNRRLRTAYFQFLFEENFRDLLVLLGDNFPEFDEQIRQFFREDNHCLPDKIHLQSFYFQKHLEELSRPGEYMLPNDISVKLIDTKSSLQEFSATIDELMCSESKVCAGFDTEFTTSIKGKLTLSIIQIAINDCVYIFDAYVLEYLSLQPQIKDLLIKLLDPKHFICLFFDATSDLQLINDKINYHNSSTSESDDAAHEPHIIDPDAVFDLKKIVHRAMKTKANALDNELKSFINNSTLTSNPSLQKLCQAILGFSLNKTETLSSWLSRPLLDSQIQYAATDAYILVLLYKKLERLSPSLSCTYNFK